jgi:hypothetical protein
LTTSLAAKITTIFKASILCISISLAFENNPTHAGNNEPIESSQITAFVYDSTENIQITAFLYAPHSSNSEVEKDSSTGKTETDDYMNEIKKSLLKDFNVLVQQLEYVKPEDANKILSTVMKMRILELDDKIDESLSTLTILNWKEKFMFTKKSKSKVESEISTLEKQIKKNSKERLIINKLLNESELKENETDNTEKFNNKINSI